MKDRLKRTLISHAFTAKMLYMFYRLKHANAAKKASVARAKTSLFNYRALTADIPYSPEEIVIDNNLYGQAHAIKKYAGIKHDLQAYIEHGLFWGGMVHQDEYYWYTERIITFSERRKADIAAKGISDKVICIGPYIHYAKPLFNTEEMQALKQELGKTLLIFPSKSILNIESKYDVDEFIGEVKRIGQDYDTILISLYFLDAQNEAVTKAYEAHGFKIVTAGHRYDHNFLARQRAFIELADMTMSNEVGTHVGYCIHLNKPHYLFSQKLERVGKSKKELARELTLYEANEDKRRNAEKDEVADAFKSYLPGQITKQQRHIIDKFWGTSSVKTPDELRAILSPN
jgi:hypothetical protein